MKKGLKVLLVSLLALALGACSTTPKTETPAPTDGGAATGDKIVIGVVVPSGDHGFTGESLAHAKKEAEAINASGQNIEVIVKDGLEASDQITSIENLLSSANPDVIVLWPMEGEALRSAAQSITDAGVKLVIYDRLIDGFTADTFVGDIMGDNVGIGTQMGNYLTTFYAEDDAVNYLRFIGDASTVGVQRSKGMDDVVDPAKFVQMKDTFVTNWSSETAQNQMEEWLAGATKGEIESLDLIVTHDDEIADGIMNALEAYSGGADLSNLKLITSIGGRKETLDKFENTKLGVKLITYYFAPGMVREAIRLGVASAQGTDYTGATLTDGVYLIPTFAISNAGGDVKFDFEGYRGSDIFTERYSIFE
ncbi:MAG: sugar ABC transporter substrate-binding protein [Anaerorhabdus sp.]|uniref:sugar ABC transporter substrate-binding protein n=1 Tax=Anaerorhabdus sp. TaxID=1872524 RepID=UPI002B1ECC8A|nr:sugar ABC transporter substrate-binding protein [Anaerorhabdus sp.]MEA4874493.1 sugar ABC transporter substrate-binding protein [Anaerorhabdus sp.]